MQINLVAIEPPYTKSPRIHQTQEHSASDLTCKFTLLSQAVRQYDAQLASEIEQMWFE